MKTIDLSKIELWLHPKQKESWVEGNELYAYLKDNDLLEDCLTLEDLEAIRKLGVKEFNKYFKDKYVYAWKSVQDRFGDLRVPCLCDYGDEVGLDWGWLDSDWSSSNPALRFSKSSKLRNSELSDPLNFALRVKNLEKKLEKVNKLAEEIINVISKE